MLNYKTEGLKLSVQLFEELLQFLYKNMSIYRENFLPRDMPKKISNLRDIVAQMQHSQAEEQ